MLPLFLPLCLEEFAGLIFWYMTVRGSGSEDLIHKEPRTPRKFVLSEQHQLEIELFVKRMPMLFASPGVFCLHFMLKLR